jgi:membrane protease YdiL (CAAX protease family)
MEHAQKNRKAFPWLFFLLAIGITWLIWSPGILSALGWIELKLPFLVFFFIGTWGPFLAAVLVTYREGGSSALKAYLKRGLNAHFPFAWVLIILATALLVSAVPLGLHVLSGGPAPVQTLLSNPLMILPVFLTYFFTGGGNEEWGWRGFALDRLQDRWNPTVASVVLGLIWGAWHAPLFFIESTGQFHMSLWIFILATPGLSVLHTWVYNRTGKNLLAVWLFHAMLGTAWEVFPIVQPGLAGYRNVYIYDFIAMTILAVVVVLVEGTRLGKKDRQAVTTGSRSIQPGD